MRADDVHRARRVPEAENIGVGSARNLHRLRVVEIDRDGGIAREIAARRVRGIETADAIRRLRTTLDIVVHAAVTIDRERGEIARALGVRLVEEDVVDIEDGGVEHLLLGDDGDGGTEVLELRVEARPGQCVRSQIAFIRPGVHLKRRELDHRVPALCRRVGRRSLGGLRLVGPLCGKFIGIEPAVFVFVVAGEILRGARGTGCDGRLRPRPNGKKRGETDGSREDRSRGRTGSEERDHEVGYSLRTERTPPVSLEGGAVDG